MQVAILPKLIVKYRCPNPLWKPIQESSRAVYHRPLKLTGAWSCKEEQLESCSTVDCRGGNGACAGVDLREVKKKKKKGKNSAKGLRGEELTALVLPG